MLTLKLYPSELKNLVGLLSHINRQQGSVPVIDQPLHITVLLAYQAKLPIGQIFAWGQRKAGRAYYFKLPVPVGKALHQVMQIIEVPPGLQSLLNQIDHVLVNYRPPQTGWSALPEQQGK